MFFCNLIHINQQDVDGLKKWGFLGRGHHLEFASDFLQKNRTE